MANEKKSSDTPTPAPKKVAKSDPAKKVAANKPAAKKTADGKVIAAAVASSQRSISPVPKAQPPASQLHDEIRRRAYELYRERGGHHGSHEADWHRAEAEVRSKYKA